MVTTKLQKLDVWAEHRPGFGRAEGEGATAVLSAVQGSACGLAGHYSGATVQGRWTRCWVGTPEHYGISKTNKNTSCSDFTTTASANVATRTVRQAGSRTAACG